MDVIGVESSVQLPVVSKTGHYFGRDVPSRFMGNCYLAFRVTPSPSRTSLKGKTPDLIPGHTDR